MHIDLTQIALALIALLSTIITGFVVPWLKSKINVENGKMTEIATATLKFAVETAVKAAEQLFNSDQGKEKKAYVLGVLKDQGYEVDLAAIDAAIEAAVLELHRELE